MAPLTPMHPLQPGDVLHDRGLAHSRLVEPRADQTSHLNPLDPGAPDAASCPRRAFGGLVIAAGAASRGTA